MTPKARLLLDALKQQIESQIRHAELPCADVIVTPRVVVERARALLALAVALEEEMRQGRNPERGAAYLSGFVDGVGAVCEGPTGAERS